MLRYWIECVSSLFFRCYSIVNVYFALPGHVKVPTGVSNSLPVVAASRLEEIMPRNRSLGPSRVLSLRPPKLCTMSHLHSHVFISEMQQKVTAQDWDLRKQAIHNLSVFHDIRCMMN